MEPPGQFTLSLGERYRGQSQVNKRFVERGSEECIEQPQGEQWQEREAARSLEKEAKLGVGGSTAQLCSPSTFSTLDRAHAA